MNRWSYNEMKLDVNFGRDAFYAEFGHGATFPQVIIGGQKVGGCTDAVKYLHYNIKRIFIYFNFFIK